MNVIEMNDGRNARRGKRTRPSIMQYQDDLEHNLIQTGEEMRAGTYRTGPYRRLWVYIPKRRLVMALDYRDRVVQWSVYQLLYPYFDRRMIEDSYACRRGKGSHKAVARLQYWLRQIDRKLNGKEWYYLKIDVSKYFYRVDHDVLLRILRRHIADPGLLDLLAGIINNPDEPFGLPPGMKPEDADFEAWLYDVGMPIGSLGLVEFGERPGSVALAVPTFDMLPGQSLDNILGFTVFENLVEVDRLTGSVEHFHKGSLLILLRCLCTQTSSFRSW